MVVGEEKHFLSCLMTMKVKPDPETLAPTLMLEDVTKDWISNISGEKVLPQIFIYFNLIVLTLLTVECHEH